MKFRKASLKDIEVLIKTRVKVLKVVNNLPEDTDMSVVLRESRRYYEKALKDNTHTAYLVFDDERFVAAGGVSYYEVMPTFHNPSGLKAYIMNIYTDPEYRRQGIGYKVIDLLVKDAKAKCINFISLEATEMGRLLYEKYGFIKMNDEMQLPMV